MLRDIASVCARVDNRLQNAAKAHRAPGPGLLCPGLMANVPVASPRAGYAASGSSCIASICSISMSTWPRQ